MRTAKNFMSSSAAIAALAAALALSSSMAKAEGPCHEYVEHCKSQGLEPGKGLGKCVAKEARKAGNKECVAKLKERMKQAKAHKGHKGEHSEGAAEGIAE